MLKSIILKGKSKIVGKGKKLKKKRGLDKLIITLVLMAVGVGLCIVYRNQIYTTMTTALTTLSSDIDNLIKGTVTP